MCISFWFCRYSDDCCCSFIYHEKFLNQRDLSNDRKKQLWRSNLLIEALRDRHSLDYPAGGSFSFFIKTCGLLDSLRPRGKPEQLLVLPMRCLI